MDLLLFKRYGTRSCSCALLFLSNYEKTKKAPILVTVGQGFGIPWTAGLKPGADPFCSQRVDVWHTQWVFWPLDRGQPQLHGHHRSYRELLSKHSLCHFGFGAWSFSKGISCACVGLGTMHHLVEYESCNLIRVVSILKDPELVTIADCDAFASCSFLDLHFTRKPKPEECKEIHSQIAKGIADSSQL
jgi:hypothetical protein